MFTPTHGFASLTAAWTVHALCGALGPHQLWGLTVAFVGGVLPDVPVALLIISGHFDYRRHRHHQWITHTPLFWILAGLLCWLLAGPWWALLLCGGALLHLATDWYGGGDGIPFLWPLTRRQFGLANTGRHQTSTLWQYYTRWPMGLVEVCVSVIGLVLLLRAL